MQLLGSPWRVSIISIYGEFQRKECGKESCLSMKDWLLPVVNVWEGLVDNGLTERLVQLWRLLMLDWAVIRAG